MSNANFNDVDYEGDYEEQAKAAYETWSDRASNAAQRQADNLEAFITSHPNIDEGDVNVSNDFESQVNSVTEDEWEDAIDSGAQKRQQVGKDEWFARLVAGNDPNVSLDDAREMIGIA